MKQERSFIASLIKYIAEFDAGNILYKAFPVRIIGGSVGGGGSTSPTDIAAGIDLSSDTETIKQNTTSTNLKLDSIDTKIAEISTDVETLVDDFKYYSSTDTLLVNPPLSGDVPISLPKIGFYSLRVITGDLTGRFRVLNGSIPLILNTPTTQTTDISNTFRDYFFWADNTSLTLDNVSNNSLVSIAFTPLDKFPSFNNSFVGVISLAANATSATINTFNFNYLSLDNLNFTINEVGSTFTPQYSGWIELRGREFTITNTTATPQTYRYKLSDNPNLAALNSVLARVIRPDNVAAADRCVIAGVDGSGLVKTPVLDASGRFQVAETNSPALVTNTGNTAANTNAIDTKLAAVVTNTSTIATIVNRDSKDYATPFTVFGSALSSFVVTTPIDRYILKSAYLRNNSANLLFIQLFNKAGGVPVTGDVPLLSIRLPANTSLFLGSDFLSPKGFLLPNVSSGVVYWGQSSTEPTFTPSLNNISIMSFGVDRLIT